MESELNQTAYVSTSHAQPSHTDKSPPQRQGLATALQLDLDFQLKEAGQSKLDFRMGHLSIRVPVTNEPWLHYIAAFGLASQPGERQPSHQVQCHLPCAES